MVEQMTEENISIPYKYLQYSSVKDYFKFK